MTLVEEHVWNQWARRGELAPPASSVSAVLGAFSALRQREPKTEDDASFVFRLATWRAERAASAIDTHVRPVAAEGTGVRAVVSAAEWHMISGIPHLRINSPDLPARPWETYRARARQHFDVPHAKRSTQDDDDFLRFVERYVSLPEGYNRTVWGPIWTKWGEERCEPQYKAPENMSKRYSRLQRRLQRRQHGGGL